ncbi:MAG: M16 family metallopeptidase [Candidatus Rokuibacteriota bacterium]
MTTRRLALAALLLVAASTPAGSAPPLAHREVLPNGIVLLVAERPTVPIVVVRVALRAGSAFDPADRDGLANLTGSLLTRGTAKRTGPQLDEVIESAGGSLEASAGREDVTASLAVLKRDVGLGLDLLAEVVLSPAFPEDEVKRRIARIQAAIKRNEADPEAVAGRALARLVFPGHPYGLPIEGTSESVGRLTRDDVVAFYRERVRPDTAVIAVVGAVTVDEARREILTRFGAWPRPATPPGVIPQAVPAAPPKSETIRKDVTQTTILLGRQAIRQNDPDYFALTVATRILGGGQAARLYRRVRDEAGLAYSVYAYLSPARAGASLVVGAQTRNAETARVFDLVRVEMERIGRDRVTDEELASAKEYLIGSYGLRLDTSARFAGYIVALEQNALGFDYPERYKREIGRVTAVDVQRVAARFLGPPAFDQVVVGGAP